MIIPRSFGVKRNKAEFADILHSAEITCQPRARGTVMKKHFANQNLMKFKGFESVSELALFHLWLRQVISILAFKSPLFPWS